MYFVSLDISVNFPPVLSRNRLFWECPLQECSPETSPAEGTVSSHTSPSTLSPRTGTLSLFKETCNERGVGQRADLGLNLHFKALVIVQSSQKQLAWIFWEGVCFVFFVFFPRSASVTHVPSNAMFWQQTSEGPPGVTRHLLSVENAPFDFTNQSRDSLFRVRVGAPLIWIAAFRKQEGGWWKWGVGGVTARLFSEH